MASEWPIRKLADLCDSVDYGYTASAKDMPCGPKFLRITDIVSGAINWKNVPYCEIEDAAHDRYRLHDADVVIARTGATTGYSLYIANPPDAVFASYLVRLKIGQEAHARFIAYFLKSHRFWSYMRGVLGDKSAQPNASAKTMTQVELLLPPLKEQQAIAYILGALDDKIELNRRMNETLEAMARAIFKSWFVDFLPVRAKQRARTQTGDPVRLPAEASAQAGGLAPHIADLFPDSFEDSELGEIPKGWEVAPLASMVELISGGTPKRSEPNYWGGDIPWFSVRDVPLESDIFTLRTQEHITQVGLDNSAAKVLSEGTAIITARGTVGKVALVGVPMAMNQSCYGVRGRDGYGYCFNYFNLRRMVVTLRQRTHGSVFDTITRDTFNTVLAVAPPVTIARAYDELVSPLLERVKSNGFASLTLAALRDTLLPRLVSGELRVPDAERIVGRCV